MMFGVTNPLLLWYYSGRRTRRPGFQERLGSKRLNATLVGVYSLSGNSRWDGRANISVLGEYRLMHVNQRGLADCEGRQSPSSVLKIVSEPRIPACCME